MVNSSSALLEQLENVAAESGDILFRADVRQFFMTGSHDDLAMHAASFISDGLLRPKIRDALNYILKNQYVDSDGQDCKRVMSGSGMGMNISSEIADAALFRSCEENFLWKARTVRWLGLKLYVSYKDDIFGVLRKAPG